MGEETLHAVSTACSPLCLDCYPLQWSSCLCYTLFLFERQESQSINFFPYSFWSRFKHLLWRRFSSYLQLIPTCCPLSISLFSTRNYLYWSIPNRLIVEGMCLLFVDELTSTTRELVAWFVQMKGELPFRTELESLSISQYDINSIFGASTPKPKSMKYGSTSVAWFLELISGRLCVISFVAKRNRYTHQRQMIQAPLQWVNPFHQQLLLLKM